MSNVVVCKVRDLAAPARQWVAQVFGRELEEDEQVTVMVFPPQHASSPADHQAAWERIRRVLNRAAENMRGVSEEEIEGAIDEAIAHVRSG